jgi:nitrate/TMAO reductase-like tetraheme cytochrome c subunit
VSQEPTSQPPRPARGARNIVVWVLAGLGVVLVLAVMVAVYFTSQPTFFARYSSFQRNYAALQTSTHKGLRCNQCHIDKRGPVFSEVALVGEFYRSLFGKPKQPLFVTMATPTREACLACHRYDWSMDAQRTIKVPHPAHLRVATEPRDCIVCHKWTGHEEVYMQKHTAMPFSTVCASFECHVGTKPANDCKNCHHVLQESLGAWKDIHPQTVRANGPNACLERCHNADQCRLCHTTGKMPVFSGTISDPGVKAIEQQHVLPDWISKHGAMALADQSKCLLCHVSEGECQDCHSKRPAFHGSQATWLGQHQPLAKANPKRCLTCHQQSWCDACHAQFKEMR